MLISIFGAPIKYEMRIIGKLLKRTNAITYKRNLKKKKDADSQLKTLLTLLQKAEKTSFGSHYQFEDVLKDASPMLAFQTAVPIVSYEEFYTNWLIKSLDDEKDVVWPGRTKHFALSSGTTGSPSKRLPVTKQMIRSFQKSSVRQLSTLHSLDLSDDFYSASVLIVGGSSKLNVVNNHYEGDLSGILKKYTSFIVAPLAKPEKKIAKETDWGKKLQLMVDKAPEWNIGIIAGVPSWCILLMENIIEKHQLNHIHDIWPNLEVYVHGGVFMDPYHSRLQKVLGRDIHLLDTFLASEGYFGYQKSPERQGMQLLLDSSIFFEFVPFNRDYFDEEGVLVNRREAFTIDEVQPGIDYALIVSTNAGLWRYMIGDLVRFTDIEQREVIITGRIKQFLSLCGEHLSLDNINQAIVQVAEELGIEMVEFTICTDEEKGNHHWFIGCDTQVTGEEIMRKLDETLCTLNDDYRSARKVTLQRPDITILPQSTFYDFMAFRGRIGAQHKFPRVLNQEQREAWMGFLGSNEIMILNC